MAGGKGWVEGGTEILLVVFGLSVTIISVEGKVRIHLADYRVILGAEVES